MITPTDDYRFLRTWQGHLTVTAATEAAGGPYDVGPADTAQFCEHGIAITPRDPQRPRVFLPWASVAVIRQEPGGPAALSAA